MLCSWPTSTVPSEYHYYTGNEIEKVMDAADRYDPWRYHFWIAYSDGNDSDNLHFG